MKIAISMLQPSWSLLYWLGIRLYFFLTVIITHHEDVFSSFSSGDRIMLISVLSSLYFIHFPISTRFLLSNVKVEIWCLCRIVSSFQAYKSYMMITLLRIIFICLILLSWLYLRIDCSRRSRCSSACSVASLSLSYRHYFGRISSLFSRCLVKRSKVNVFTRDLVSLEHNRFIRITFSLGGKIITGCCVD